MGSRSDVTLSPRFENRAQGRSRGRRSPLPVLAVALIIVGLNLRTTVASLPPLLGSIRQDIPFSGAIAGLMTATPVLCMAWLAPVSARVAARLGYGPTLLSAVCLISLGNGLRGLATSALTLILATLVAGAGVSVCGVVAPALIKESFPGRQGAATGSWSVAMMLGSAAAAAFSVPLATALGSWNASLSAWACPAALAAVVWLIVSRRRAGAHDRDRGRRPHVALPWRSRPAWLLVIFLSAQSSLAYSYIGWLAPAYVARGWEPGKAGALAAVSNIAQLLAALVLPALSDRIHAFRLLVVGAVTLTVVGTTWLWLQPDRLPFAAATVVGLGLGAGFSLGLTRIAHYASDPGSASRLTAMVFLISYSVAALGPVSVGALHDVTGSYVAPMGLLVLVALAQWTVAGRLSDQHRGAVL
jgi:MFS transporter, CP family, cyanate transporter